MINWLIQTEANLPPGNPADWLSHTEQEQYATLTADKRRHDWLLGRWTAKRLVQAFLMQKSDQVVPVSAIIIIRDWDGAPLLTLDPAYRHRALSLDDIRLSISHSGDRALCVLSGDAKYVIGCDIERIEPRAWGFVEDYCTNAEVALVRSHPESQRETIITAIWSAKEAALKALRLGLSVDTRSISCSLAAQGASWSPVIFSSDQELLGWPSSPMLAGWWWPQDGYVLTVASLALAAQGEHALAYR